MKAVIEIRIEAEGGPYVREVACVERAGHRLADIGLSLAESKSLLTAVQKIVVEHQTAEYLEDRHKCPHCGKQRIQETARKPEPERRKDDRARGRQVKVMAYSLLPATSPGSRMSPPTFGTPAT